MPNMPWNLIYLLDIAAISHFAISYYRNCYRAGYRIDLWHAELFLMCVLPNLIMLPFARSELNAVILGSDFSAVIAVLPTVFLITLLGYFAIVFGGGLWRIKVGLGLRKAAFRFLDIVPRCSMMLMSSKSLMISQAALCCLLQVAILGVYFAHSGFGLNLRTYTFAHPELRPAALLASNYSIVIASHCLARYLDKKERILLGCTLLLTFGLVFFGARSSLLAIYINVLLCYMVKLRARISLSRITGTIIVIVLLGLYLGNVRAGQYSLGEFFSVLTALLLYGDTFSDLRDFSWVYARWDHVFWVGKTYLAALMAFIPRFASTFRDTWGMGVATATTVGFDPQVHPGLRPGVFGEGFFNFGLPGVILIGLMLGIVLRRVDIDVKRALLPPHPSIMKSFASTMQLSVAGSLAITAGFSSLYILAAIYLFSWLCLRAMHLVQPHRVSLSNAG
jgi:oligosaccharide repeat unit polymerase